MLHSLKTIDGFDIAAMDGNLGQVKDIYFDDRNWVVRYLEVDTGGWLTGRKVLISPISVSGIDWAGEAISLNLTRQQVHDSPDIDTARPVSRQHETAFFDYYGFPYYWTGLYIEGQALASEPIKKEPLDDPSHQATRQQPKEDSDDPHLRSKDEVVGYEIQAADDTVGHVEDFLFDEKDWAIPLMVIDTRNWWPGKHVLISPKLIEHVSWQDRSVVVKVTRKQIEISPEYDQHHPPVREVYEDVYRQFGAPAPISSTVDGHGQDSASSQSS